MNLNVRYDLLEETQIANKGFSLKRYTKNVLKATAIGTTILLPMKTIDGISLKEVVDTVVLNLEIYAGIYGFCSAVSKTNEQEFSLATLDLLSSKLNRHNINITPTMLRSAKKQKTEYSLSFSSFPPDINQKTYISFSNSEETQNQGICMLQEHTIGTPIYSLSQPDKVYVKNR